MSFDDLGKNSYTNKDAALVLSNAYVTPLQFEKLFAVFKDGEGFFRKFAAYEKIASQILGEQKYLEVKSNLTSEYLEYQRRKYGECGISMISIFDDEYPERLKHIGDSPYMLYCAGDVALLNPEIGIAVCGTRRCTIGGRKAASDFVNYFACCGITTVCGDSEGIQDTALKKALESDGKAIMVLTFGADAIKDAPIGSLISKVVRSGLVVTELPFGAGYHNYLYAAANRIVTGLSDGILLVEAGEGSGALKTCDIALDQNKELFVLPGPITSSVSVGTNALIKEFPESMITKPEEIYERFNVKYIPSFVFENQSKKERKNKQNENVYNDMSDDEKQLMLLLENDDLSLNEIVAQSNINISELGSLLSCLELLGVVEKTSQGRYRKKTEE